MARVEGLVVVLGLGYIGLPTATVLASTGLRVIGVDTNPAHVEAVNRGEVPFVEPDLAAHVAAAVTSGHLRALAEVPPRLPAGTTYIIAVPTPLTLDHEADLSFIDMAIDSLTQQLIGDELIILESTSPPGTTQRLAHRVLAARPDLSLDGSSGRPRVLFAHCPERVLPGRVMIELVANDRIIGGLTPEAAERARDLYSRFSGGTIHLTDATTAELAKLAENSFRDVNIAFANELSIISERLNADVFEVIDLANKHPRVNILQPGPGVGGHCIAVDPWFIVSAAPEEARLIREARRVNDSKPDFVISKALEAAGSVDDPVIACLGLAFKPDIDDLRGSPAAQIVERLAQEAPLARILVVEPNIKELPKNLRSYDNIQSTDVETALGNANIVLLLVDHSTFRNLDPARLKHHITIDTKGIWRGST